jgi:hypothetical protein
MDLCCEKKMVTENGENKIESKNQQIPVYNGRPYN